MDSERQELLRKIKNLKRQKDGKIKRMSFLEENVREVKEYKKHQDDVLSLQEEINQSISQLQCKCDHLFFETGVEYDKILDVNMWKIQCLKCGFETVFYQMTDLDNPPSKEMIRKDNVAHLGFLEAKRMFAMLEKEKGEEEAKQEVLSLSRRPR